MSHRPNTLSFPAAKDGWTLGDLIVVLLVIGILVTIAVSKMVDFRSSAQIAATKGVLASVRSVYMSAYTLNAQSGRSEDPYPNSLGASDFANGQEPLNSLTGNRGVQFLNDEKPNGLSTHENKGFWVWDLQNSGDRGTVGAYSDGTHNTAGW